MILCTSTRIALVNNVVTGSSLFTRQSAAMNSCRVLKIKNGKEELAGIQRHHCVVQVVQFPFIYK